MTISALSSSANLPFLEESQYYLEIPEELLINIFKFLSAIELSHCACVSWEWRRIASKPILWSSPQSMKDRFPLIKNIFDNRVWMKHLGKIDLNLRFQNLQKETIAEGIKVLKGLIHLKIKGDLGITLLQIPAGLTLNKLKLITQIYEEVFPDKFLYFEEQISEHLGDIEIEEPYTIFISNAILTSTKKKKPHILSHIFKREEGRSPRLIEVMTLVILNAFQSIRNSSLSTVYPNDKQGATYCVDMSESDHVIVGGVDLNDMVVDLSLDYANYGTGWVKVLP